MRGKQRRRFLLQLLSQDQKFNKLRQKVLVLYIKATQYAIKYPKQVEERDSQKNYIQALSVPNCPKDVYSIMCILTLKTLTNLSNQNPWPILKIHRMPEISQRINMTVDDVKRSHIKNVSLCRSIRLLWHIRKAGLDLGLWTLDSGLWTLDFFLLKLYPPEKPLYLPPKKRPPQKKFPPPNKKFN